MKANKRIRRMLCVLLALGMLAGDYAGIGSDSAAKAAAKAQKQAQTEAALKKELAKTKDRYPNGAFDILNTQNRAEEGKEKKQTITIVREGGTDKKSSVTFKAIDVTATYGEDYLLYVDGKPIERPEGMTTMMDVLGLNAKYKADAVAEDTTAASGSAVEPTPIVKTEDKVPNVKQVKEDDLSPLQRGVKAQTGKVEEQKDWRALTENDVDYKEAEKTMKQGDSDVQQIAEAIDGPQYTFIFNKGEYKKQIELEILDDEVSEGDEQTMLILTEPKVSELGAAYHGYLDITDDEKEVKAKYTMKDSFYVAAAGEESVKVSVKKTGALSRMTVTDITTTDGTAKLGEDYAFETRPLVFAPGEKEKQVTIPVKNTSTKKDKYFYVGIDSGDGKADEHSGIAKVTINKAKKAKAKKKTSKYEKADKTASKSEEKLEAKADDDWWKPRFTGGSSKTWDESSDDDYTVLTYSGNSVPESHVCTDQVIEYMNADEVAGHDGEYDQWHDIPTAGDNQGEWIDFTNVDKIEIDYSSRWCEGTKTYDRFLFIKYNEQWQLDRSVGFCVFDNEGGQTPYYFKNTSVGKINKTTCTLELDGKLDTTGKLKYFVRGVGANRVTGASIEIYQVRIYYKKYNVTIINDDYKQSNSYIEQIYSGDKNVKDGAVFSQLAEATVGGESKTAWAALRNESINVSIDYNQNKTNSCGLSPTENNTEFLGFMALGTSENPVKPMNLPIEERVDVPAEGATLKFSDLLDYRKYAHEYNGIKNCIVLAPVFRPRTVRYVFKSSDGSGIYQGYEMDKDPSKALETTMLDTVTVEAAPAKSGISVGKYTAVDEQGLEMKVVEEKDGNTLKGKVDLSPTTRTWFFEGGNANRVPVITVETVKGALSLKVMARPGSTDNLDMMAVSYINATEKEEEKEEGIASKDTNYQFTLSKSLALGERFNLVGTTNTAVAGDQRYTILWQDASCDTNEDGILSNKELKAMYGTDDASEISDVKKHKGDSLRYRMNKQDAKIYYEVRKANPAKGQVLAGAVCVKDKELFTGEASETYVNGADVVMGGELVQTNTAEKNAYYNGGPGYYELKGGGCIEPDGNYSVSVNYSQDDGSTLSGYVYAQSNVFTKVNLETYSVMDVKSASVGKPKDDKNLLAKKDFEKVEYYSMDNSDTEYKLSFNVTSKDNTRIPTKAYLRFYRKDGNRITFNNKTVTNEDGSQQKLDGAEKIEAKIDLSGNVSFLINPKKLELPAGTTMKLQIEDQLAKVYPQRATGISLKVAIEPIMVATSFIFGSDSTVVKLIGWINSHINLRGEASFSKKSGMSGSVVNAERELTDDEKRYYKVKFDKEGINLNLDKAKMQSVTITLGWAKDDLVEKKFFKQKTATERKAEADKELAKAKMTNEIIEDYELMGEPIPTTKKKKPKYKKVSDEDMKKLTEKAETAQREFEEDVFMELTGTKEKPSLSANLKIGLKFSFALNFNRDLDPRKDGALYFDSFLFVVQADGEYSLSKEFMLPIGITVKIGFSVGAQLGATFIVENPLEYDKHGRYYMQKVEGGNDLTEKAKEGDELTIWKMLFADEKDDFKCSGVFDVCPFVSITANGSWGGDIIGAEAQVDGKAQFKMKFYAGYRAGNNGNYGSVTLSASIKARVSIFEHTWKWETKPLRLFGTLPLSAEGFDSREYIAEDASLMKATDFDYMATRPGWQGDAGQAIDENSLSIKATASNDPGVLMQSLQQQVYAGTRVDIKSIGGGNYMAVFLDADPSRKLDVNKVAAYYTIYTGSTGTWSKPVLLDNNKTADDDVKLVDLGDRGMIAVWVDSSAEFTDKTKKTDTLEMKNLSGRFFNKSTKTFGDVMEITRDTTEDAEAKTMGYDRSADLKPNIIYSDAKKSLICYYTKCEYEYTESEGEKVGDVTYPTYSKMAYREYRFSGDNGTDGEWIEDYTKLTDQDVLQDIKDAGYDLARYQNVWYGQVTFETLADVYIDESVDSEGYWTNDMLDGSGKISESRIFKGHKVEGTAKMAPDQDCGVVNENTKVSGSTKTVSVEEAPRIIDSDAVNYKSSAGDDYGMFAYTVDYDQDLGTTKDRDIYLQYFDFTHGHLIHPIIITSDNVADGNVKFVKNDQGTYLAWIHDGDLMMFALKNLEDHVIKRTTDKTTYYILDKTAPKITPTMTAKQKEAEYAKAYTPAVMIADGHRHIKDKVLFPGDEGYPSDKKDGEAYYPDGQEDSEGVITDFDVSATGGVTYFTWTETISKTKDGIDEESEEAAKPENRLIESQLWMARIQAGDENTDTEITKPVQVTNYKGTNFNKVATEVTNEGNLKLVAVKAGTSVTKNKKDSYTSIASKKDLIGMNVVPDTKPEIETDEEMLDRVVAGKDNRVAFNIHNNGLARSEKLTVKAVDGDGKSILLTNSDDAEKMKPTDSITFDNMLGGSSEEVICNLAPAEDATKTQVTITVTGANGAVLDTKTVKKTLRESIAVNNLKVTETDQRDVFNVDFEVANEGRRYATAKKATIGVMKNNKKTKLATVSIDKLGVGKEAIYGARVKANSATQFVSGAGANGGILETGTFYVEVAGQSTTTLITREATKAQKTAMSKLAAKLSGGNEANIGIGQKYYGLGLKSTDKTWDKQGEVPGVKAVYVSSDPKVATVSGDGIITGRKKGTTTVKVIAMPADTENNVTNQNQTDTKFSGTFGEKLNGYPSMPSTALKTYSVTVNVAGGSGKTTVGGVNYKKSGKVAVVTGAKKTLKTANIKATVRIGGKTLKVTKINKNAFKNCKKLTKVTIGKNVKTVGANAFSGCKKLKKVIFKSKAAPTIGNKAFNGIPKKAVFDVPNKSKKKYKKKLKKKTGFKKTMKVK